MLHWLRANKGIEYDRDPIFIGGTGRSGTTILTRVLGRHPQVFSFRWESQFLTAKNGLLDALEQGLGRTALSCFEKNMRGRWYKRTVRPGTASAYDAGLCEIINAEALDSALQGLRKKAKRAKSLGDRRECVRQFTNAIFSPEMQRSRAEVWCEKTPRNILYATDLQQLYPEMRFVHIVRDGRDVASSMVDRQFWPVAPSERFPETKEFNGHITVEKAAAYWETLLELADCILGKLPEENYIHVRFEDLMSQPEVEFSRILNFVGVDSSSEVIDEILDVSGGPRLRSESAHIGRWRGQLTEEERASFDRIAGDMLERYGYPC